MPAPAGAQGLFAAWELSLQQLVSSLHVAASQDSGAGARAASAGKQAASAGAATLITHQGATAVAEAKRDYGADSGAGRALCAVARAAARQDAARTARTQAGQAFAQTGRTWLAQGGDGGARLGASLARRRSLYCPAAQVAGGWCKQGKGPEAGDSDASPWLASRHYGAPQIRAAADYLDVVAPLPTIDPAADTAQTQAVLIEARRQGAILSLVRANLGALVADGLNGGAPQGKAP